MNRQNCYQLNCQYPFGYAPLIWMFTSKNTMLKVNKIHWRTLRVVYDDYSSTYEELFPSHNDISIHQKHLKHLAIEVYKSLANMNPEFMWLFLKNKSIPYNLRNGNISILPPARSSHYRIKSVQFRGSLLWTKLFLLKNSSRNWIMYKIFTVLVLHVKYFKFFFYYYY